MDIRLKTETLDYCGRRYLLRCNMNVLADVQEHYGGDLKQALSGKSVRSVLVFLSAMMNDYAEEKGWPRVTDKVVGRNISFAGMSEVREKVMRLVTDAVRTPDGVECTEAKNGKTTRSK